MRIKPSKFFMNEADASPGGGAVIPPQAESPAQTATPAPAAGVSLDQVKSLLGEMQTGLKNGLFAELRKAGVLKQEKPAEQPNQAAPVSTGLSATDVEAMLERERVITARATKFNLSDAQTKRMKSALSGVAVDSFATEADSYLADMGLAKAPTPAAPAAITATPAQEAPKPPAMAPSAPTGHGLPTQAGVVDLFSLNDQQRKDLGPKGIRQVLEQLSQIGNDQAGIPQRPKPPSQR